MSSLIVFYRFALFVVSVYGVVGGEVQASTLLTLEGPARNQITHVDHVAELANVLRGFDALEEALCLLIEHVETVPGTVQAQVRADDAHIVRHNLIDFLHALGDEHLSSYPTTTHDFGLSLKFSLTR